MTHTHLEPGLNFHGWAFPGPAQWLFSVGQLGREIDIYMQIFICNCMSVISKLMRITQDMYSSLLCYCSDKTRTKSSLEAYIWLTLSHHSHHKGKLDLHPRIKNRSRNRGDHCLLACSPWLTQLPFLCPGPPA